VWKWEAGSGLTIFLFARVCQALDSNPSDSLMQVIDSKN